MSRPSLDFQRTWCVVVCALLLALASCETKSTESGVDYGDRSAMFENLGNNVVLATYTEFSSAVDALDIAVDTWQASGTVEDRALAQARWREAIAIWQRAEVFQLGPGGVMGDVVAGEGLRDEIYSWPVVNPCRVDQELVEQAYADQLAFAAEQVNVRGLDALEYLLFRTGTQNACAATSAINSDGTWAALDEPALESRRAEYAATLTDLLKVSASQLADSWSPASGDFVGHITGAGQTGSVYATTAEALNALSDGLFYLDTMVKDMKLAQPAGLMDCLETTCPLALESQHATVSKAHVRANLVGFRQLFEGDGGESFDDLLRDLGSEALAVEMLARIDDAIAAVDAVDGTFDEALAAAPEQVVAVYDATKAITDLLKTQFIGILNLELPARAEGDND